jgi:hypothetical protein
LPRSHRHTTPTILDAVSAHTGRRPRNVELARLSGVAPNEIVRYLSGKRTPLFPTGLALVHASGPREVTLPVLYGVSDVRFATALALSCWNDAKRWTADGLRKKSPNVWFGYEAMRELAQLPQEIGETALLGAEVLSDLGWASHALRALQAVLECGLRFSADLEDRLMARYARISATQGTPIGQALLAQLTAREATLSFAALPDYRAARCLDLERRGLHEELRDFMRTLSTQQK